MITGPEAIEPGLLSPPYELQELFRLFASRSYNAELKVEHDKSLPTNSFNCTSLYGLSLKNTSVQNNQEPKKSLPVK
jgi:hypothetical protein